MPNLSPTSTKGATLSPITPILKHSSDSLDDSFGIDLTDTSNDVESYIRAEQSKIDSIEFFIGL